MHFLIYFLSIHSVITFNDDWGQNDKISLIQDMSTTCVDDLRTDMYLPLGMGVADSVVILVSDNDLYPNCEIIFYTAGFSKGVHLIVVVEFPDHTEGTNHACQEVNSGIKLLDHNVITDVCREVNKKPSGYYETPVFHRLSNASNVTIYITSKSLFETVKITATAARKLGKNDKCNEVYEILCIIDDMSACVSKELLCDENINCGSMMTNDEDVRTCDVARYKRLWLVVVCVIMMLLVIIYFLIHLLRTCVPHVADNFFIFNEDEDNKLILATKFTSPPLEARKQVPLKRLDVQTSSFKFKTVPVDAVPNKTQSILKAATPSSEKPQKKASFRNNELSRSSEEKEIELKSQIYRDAETNRPVELERSVKQVQQRSSVETDSLFKKLDGSGEAAKSKPRRPRPRFMSEVTDITDVYSGILAQMPLVDNEYYTPPKPTYASGMRSSMKGQKKTVADQEAGKRKTSLAAAVDSKTINKKHLAD